MRHFALCHTNTDADLRDLSFLLTLEDGQPARITIDVKRPMETDEDEEDEVLRIPVTEKRIEFIFYSDRQV